MCYKQELFLDRSLENSGCPNNPYDPEVGILEAGGAKDNEVVDCKC